MSSKPPLFRFYAGRDMMRGSGFVVWLSIRPRPDIMGPEYGYPYDEGREILCWLFVEVRIPWPLLRLHAHSDLAEIRFRKGVRALMEDRAA